MSQRGKKVVRGKARAGEKGPTSARDLDTKRIAGGVKGGKPTKNWDIPAGTASPSSCETDPGPSRPDYLPYQRGAPDEEKARVQLGRRIRPGHRSSPLELALLLSADLGVVGTQRAALHIRGLPGREPLRSGLARRLHFAALRRLGRHGAPPEVGFKHDRPGLAAVLRRPAPCRRPGTARTPSVAQHLRPESGAGLGEALTQHAREPTSESCSGAEYPGRDALPRHCWPNARTWRLGAKRSPVNWTPGPCRSGGQRNAATRRLIQRVLGGSRITCDAFDDGERRAYRFQATGTSGGLLSNDDGGPNGTRP